MRSARHRHRHRHGRQRRGRAALVVTVAIAAELAALRMMSGRFGGDTIVRCRDGHLFTTIWIPAVSFKALRLGPRRYQRCPVGRHWTWVRPVDRSTLSSDELERAQAAHDIRIP